MSDSRSDWCGYEWPADCDRVEIQTADPIHQSCYIRDSVEDAERCVWHVDPGETDEKTVEALANARAPAEITEKTSPYTELLDGAILPGIPLNGAITFENTALQGADLTDVNLSDADLRGAGLSDADLRRDSLRRADLRGTTFAGVELDQRTQIGRRCPRGLDVFDYDKLAQSYHELKTAFSDQGLSQRGRDVRFLEQVARRREAWERGQYLTWAGSILSHGLTRYGTRVWPVLIWTGLVLALPTVWYALGPAPAEGWEGGPLYYSVVTFVTAPPHPFETSGGWAVSLTRTIILVQTYLGTTLIILLGYVLGSRDRI